MRKELLKGLTDGQIKKVEACKNSEEILALAKAEGVELNEEQLEAVSGGGCGQKIPDCPDCGGADVKRDVNDHGRYVFTCRSCGHKWMN